MKGNKSPWKWVPTLYFAEGIPYAVVATTFALIMYKRLGLSNTDAALYTSWLYLPWVIKPFWSPFVDIIKTKRWWIIAMQSLIAMGLAGVAFCIPLSFFLQSTLALLWLVAFSSATHDISADGFYMLGLSEKEQSLFVGIRSTFYRISMIVGQGALVILAGYLEDVSGLEPVVISVSEEQAPARREGKDFTYDAFVTFDQANNSSDDTRTATCTVMLNEKPESPITLAFRQTKGNKSIEMEGDGRFVIDEHNWEEPIQLTFKCNEEKPIAAEFVGSSGDIPFAWSSTFFVCAGLFIALALYHSRVLPRPAKDKKVTEGDSVKSFFSSFGSFFTKKGIGLSIAFILLFRLGEAQLTKIASPFLMDSVSSGGLGLSTSEIGFAYGTVGVLALTIGGILGGILVSRDGLSKWIWPMVLSMNMPNLLYVYMSYAQPESYALVCGLVGIEQFGYGFGFTAFMLYLIYISRGEYSTSHYAICTGLMALGMMLPGMIAGWAQSQLGYLNFFIWVCICTLPGMLLIKWLKIEADFGKK